MLALLLAKSVEKPTPSLCTIAYKKNGIFLSRVLRSQLTRRGGTRERCNSFQHATILPHAFAPTPPDFWRGRLEKGLQGHFEAGGEYTERPSFRGLRLLAGSPTVVMALIQGVPGCIPWSVRFALLITADDRYVLR